MASSCCDCSASAAAPQHETARGGSAGEKEPAHEQTLLQTVAKLANFAILAGVLVYFLRGPITRTSRRARWQIRQDLVTAAEMREDGDRAARGRSSGS